MAIVRFENGTIRIEGAVPDLPDVERDPRSKTGRAPAYRYAAVRESLEERDVSFEDNVLDVPEFELTSSYELRDYQRAALDAWRERNRRGVIELPTGSGKTVIGLAAIEDVGTPTLVVVPTVDLLAQWREELETEFGVTIGQLGGGEQIVQDLTVATYDSAFLRADELGDRFGLLLFDEVHHLGGERFRETARLMAAPARLGLTATFERPDGAHEEVEELVGPLVYSLDPDELAGDHLAPYDVKRIEVALSEDERTEYEENQATFTDYLARSGIDMRSGQDYRKLVMRSGNDPAAREALLARQRAKEVALNADAKMDALEEILSRHREDRVLLFTAHNDLVYRIAERFLIPAITHSTPTAERREYIEGFRRGEYRRLVTSNVLDEGIDVPDANVAVVMSGSGSEREFVQRLGRVLRPKEGGGRALMYEVVSEDTTEERIAQRRR